MWLEHDFTVFVFLAVVRSISVRFTDGVRNRLREQTEALLLALNLGLFMNCCTHGLFDLWCHGVFLVQDRKSVV